MNTYYVSGIPFDGIDAISHHGIKGQKWGIRRYQNPDGTLTEAGKARYGRSVYLGKKQLDKGNHPHKEGIKAFIKNALASATIYASLINGPDAINAITNGVKSVAKTLIKNGTLPLSTAFTFTPYPAVQAAYIAAILGGTLAVTISNIRSIERTKNMKNAIATNYVPEKYK